MLTQVSENTAQKINNLIVINNDRYQGYKKAAEETTDKDLQPLFMRYANQSKGFADALAHYIPADKKPDHNETTTSGKIYRVWMDAKAALTANDRKAILASCEFGEDVAKGTYENELKESKEFDTELLRLVSEQHAELTSAHDYIKNLRDNAS
jgi:uncharacterized protein (TIGR02284 family)